MAAELQTRRGRIRPLAVTFISLLAVVSIVISGLPTAARILLPLAVALVAYRSLAGPAPHTIKLDRSGSPSLDGLRGNLSGEAVTGLFIALKLAAPDGSTQRAFLFCDELRADEFRALLAYLRHG
ncbi:MAG TPA: hypothetical protein VKO85_05940 [Wenzhouxiangellaceae bacterium]|nr:hypothetical protein [Wenzhouxiangellaceae bacterium]